MDKTGTLTLGTPQVVDVKTFNGKTEAQVITLAVLAEKFSEHPLAKAVLEKANEQGICTDDPSNFEVIPGQGRYRQLPRQRSLSWKRKTTSNQKSYPRSTSTRESNPAEGAWKNSFF